MDFPCIKISPELQFSTKKSENKLEIYALNATKRNRIQYDDPVRAIVDSGISDMPHISASRVN